MLKTNTDSHRKAEQVLRQAGYRPLRQFQPTKDARSHKDELFEVWVSAAGCAFYWTDGGLDWDQTAERLKDPVGGQWQPMETAPKDRQRILVKQGGAALIVWWETQEGEEERSADAPGWHDGNCWREGLTGWMPLPR